MRKSLIIKTNLTNLDKMFVMGLNTNKKVNSAKIGSCKELKL